VVFSLIRDKKLQLQGIQFVGFYMTAGNKIKNRFAQEKGQKGAK